MAIRDDVVLAEIKKGKSVKNRLVKKKKKKRQWEVVFPILKLF